VLTFEFNIGTISVNLSMRVFSYKYLTIMTNTKRSSSSASSSFSPPPSSFSLPPSSFSPSHPPPPPSSFSPSYPPPPSFSFSSSILLFRPLS